MVLTEWHRQQAARIAAAHPLDGRPARASGNHLAAQNDEPEPLTEADLLAVDRASLASKQADPYRQSDADRAMHEEIRRPPGHWR